MPRSQTHQPVECLSYHGVKSRTLGLFTPCHYISKPIVILRSKKSQGKVSRGKESQGKVSWGKKSLHRAYVMFSGAETRNFQKKSHAFNMTRKQILKSCHGNPKTRKSARAHNLRSSNVTTI